MANKLYALALSTRCWLARYWLFMRNFKFTLNLFDWEENSVRLNLSEKKNAKSNLN